MESFAESSFLIKHKQMLMVKMGLHVGIDILFALLMTTFLFSKEALLSSYVPALCMVFIIIMTFLIVSTLKPWIFKLLLGALAISLVLSIYFFSAAWWVMLAILVFLHWRITSYTKSNDASIEVSSGSVLIFLFIASFSLLTGSIRDLGNTNIIYSLLFILLSIIITLTPIQRMLSDVKNDHKKVLLKPMGFWLLVTLAGGILAIFSSLASKGIYWGAEKVFWVFSFLVDPIYDQLIKLRDMFLSTRDAQEGEGSEVQKQDLGETPDYELTQGLSFSWVNEVLLGLLVIAVIIYLVKKRKSSLDMAREAENSPTMMTQKIVPHVEEDDRDRISYSKARDVIRLSMEKLEGEAHRWGAGRQQNENVQLWFNRIGLSESERFFSLYERIRYGQSVPSQQEVDYFTNQIEHHIGELKEREDQ
ncbi:hypothetical protein N5C46_06015 [Rossellomorea vietnamensis]|uniref:Uncharacterized protein n=1 Tax=Rossellomorea vietnamensis TaxID=218284 RepID=A0ACD4CAH2_9BACI|nr:hypothetical protein [Rossellomorea vietnamensis]UXH45620.1 hypothetical protein N5C46_06015 [Rossellomorea vietnamensis]